MAADADAAAWRDAARYAQSAMRRTMRPAQAMRGVSADALFVSAADNASTMIKDERYYRFYTEDAVPSFLIAAPPGDYANVTTRPQARAARCAASKDAHDAMKTPSEDKPSDAYRLTLRAAVLRQTDGAMFAAP